MKARNKKTGEIVEVYENNNLYLMKNGNIYGIDTFDRFYEVVEDTPKPISSSDDNGQHPYIGSDINVGTKETWRDRFEVKFVNTGFMGERRLVRQFLTNYKTSDPISLDEQVVGELENFFQQELERIKTNFMTEFTDPDTNLLNISKYDHEEIINFFNKEIHDKKE